jgi:peroxiredoxin
VELPRLQTIWEKHRDQGFEVIAIESNRETKMAKKFIEEAGLEFTCLENGEGESEAVEGVFQVTGYPTSFIVDRQGRIVYFHAGFDEGDEKVIEEEVLSLLEG